ncbi:MAG TPA: WXG100 family type VII secretion target [Pseudonocardiaceae bacterium]
MSKTNFAQYNHQQLCAMLYAGSPQTARSMAATWDDTGNALHDQVNRLDRQLSGFSDSWTGGAADQYKTMVTDLIGGIRKVADTAYSMRNMAEEAAQAQETARAEMPMPVDVPVVPPAAVALASAPIQVDANTPAVVVAQIQQARAAAIAAVQGQQAASVAADAAQVQAVQVMQTLAADYATAQSSIPPAPDAAAVPVVPGTTGVPTTTMPVMMPISTIGGPTDTSWSVSGDLGSPTPGTDPTSGVPISGAIPKQPQSPLFGDMFTAGVAAASAAVFGRFGSLIPKVPGFASKKGPATPGTGTTPQLGDRTAAASGLGPQVAGAGAGGAALAGLKGLGGGGGIGGIGGGIGGMATSAPSASPSMLGASGMTSELAAAGGAAGGAAAGASGMPMMPMMPMGGMMGGGDMGGARRIPPWLVETEDVWGESSSVSPTVIGED